MISQKLQENVLLDNEKLVQNQGTNELEESQSYFIDFRVSELEHERHEIRRLSDAVHIKTQVSGSPVHRLSSSIRFWIVFFRFLL